MRDIVRRKQDTILRAMPINMLTHKYSVKLLSSKVYVIERGTYYAHN